MKVNQLRIKVKLVLFALFSLTLSAISQTKPVKGTWVNISYQDVRNKYMNPSHVDYLDAAFWEKKVDRTRRNGYRIHHYFGNRQ